MTMTQPTRRQLMAGSLAALGAAGAPAIAIGNEQPEGRDSASELEGLRTGIEFLVALDRIKQYPVEDRRAFVAELRSGLSDDADCRRLIAAVERKLEL